MQVKRKMSGGKSAHSFYPAPGIYHLLPIYGPSFFCNYFIIPAWSCGLFIVRIIFPQCQSMEEFEDDIL